MSRSFQGFLVDYCRELSGLETTSLRRFLDAVGDQPRLAEPLLLLAIASGREGYLMRHVGAAFLEALFRGFLAGLSESGFGLEGYLERLPDGDRFKKVYLVWCPESTQLERDRFTLKRVAAEMDRLIAEKGLSRAEVCRKAKVDKGNLYAFLKGDVARMGRATAMRVYRTLSALPEKTAD